MNSIFLRIFFFFFKYLQNFPTKLNQNNIMNKNHLKIDISKFKYVGEEEDLIRIKLEEEDEVQVSFSKLVTYSKYIRDKYKYSEAKIFIEHDLKNYSKNNNIKTSSIKHFIELFYEEQVTIFKEEFFDIYRLSEYFDIGVFIFSLDELLEERLYKDIDITLEFLKENQEILYKGDQGDQEEETRLNDKIENFLSTHINECLLSDEMNVLSTSTIYRLLEDSCKETLDFEILIEFIFKSLDTRFIFLKFVELHKLSEGCIENFFQHLRETSDKDQERYFDYIQFDFKFYERAKTRYDLLLTESKETKIELLRNKEEQKRIQTKFEATKFELEDCKEELERTKNELFNIREYNEETKIKLEQTDKELNETKRELNQTLEQFEQTNTELEKTTKELNQTKIKHDETKEELEQIQKKLKEAIYEIQQEKRENEKYTQSVVVAGNDQYNQLGEKSNNKEKDDIPIISPPMILSFDYSSLLSYSIYFCHSVLVQNNGSLQGIGYNLDGSISSSLTKANIRQFTEFSIKDESGYQLTPISAVCGYNGTLYMFSKNSVCGIGKQLVYCDCEINGGNPVFLDIGNHEPVALFGGRSHAATICDKGEIIFINRDSVKKSPNSPISSVSLPNDEKATSVACCNNSIVALSSNGLVFSSVIAKQSNFLKFSIIEELAGEEIICVSGIDDHFLAVSKEGRVFGSGSNQRGQLGLGKKTKSVSIFTEISLLNGYEIRSAYAGCAHSLFETCKGKILSCGSNKFGQLLLSCGQGEDVYSPTETTIRGGSTFCIAGNGLSVVFIGIDPPPNTPNRRIQQK